MTRGAFIAGTGETPYQRHAVAGGTTARLLAEAARAALVDAQLEPRDIDGLGVASFTLAPDHAVDLAVALGISVTWVMDGATGGASALDMLQHARRAIESGDATNVLLVAGDRFGNGAFAALVKGYNVATATYLQGIPTGGPNALFALLTQRHMERHGLGREAYGRLVVVQRAHAASNPNAAFRDPIEIADYLAAPVVSDPLCLLDCVPVVAGADAVVLSGRPGPSASVRIRALTVTHNSDNQLGDGLVTGLAHVRQRFWADARAGPSDIDVASVYDDYPAMILIQLADLGFAEGDALGTLVDRIESGALPVNTAGGQLSAGQAGAAGGMHGLVEVVRQLQGVASAITGEPELGLVTGYGTVAYRHGASAHAAVLERLS